MAEGRLDQREKELIACGAAVSAGCQKCANYHFKQAFKEGASKEEVKKAVEAATCVIQSSDEILQRKAYSLMEIERVEVPEQCADVNDRITVLIKIAAAVAANNTNNIERYINLAKSLNLSHVEMSVATKLGKVVLHQAGEFAEDRITETLMVEP